jgi:hypothetical protein
MPGRDLCVPHRRLQVLDQAGKSRREVFHGIPSLSADTLDFAAVYEV